jgi:hypothetical protein
MFHLGVIDHVRLNLARAAKNYTVHAKAAERLARRTSRARIAMLILVGGATAATIASLIQVGRPLQIAAVAANGVAFGAFAAYLAVNFEGRVLSHRTCAQRLLVICDRYRSLTAEIRDGILDRPTILARRDELGAQVHSLYEQPFAPDQNAFETLRQDVDELDVSEEALRETLQPAETGRSLRR